GQAIAVDIEEDHAPAGRHERELGVEHLPASVVSAAERAVGRSRDLLRSVERQHARGDEVDLAVSVDVEGVELGIAVKAGKRRDGLVVSPPGGKCPTTLTKVSGSVRYSKVPGACPTGIRRFP